MAVLDLPPTLEQVSQLQGRMLEALEGGAAKLKTVLPAEELVSILRATEAQLRSEPTLVELSIEDTSASVYVFGDTHGHFPDVAYILKEIGYPSPTRILVFNGDYVDRGSWGVELVALLCCLKCAVPKSVYILRGNHESSSCTKWYGYSQEIRAKYGKQYKDVYSASKKLFSVMPLAALIQGNTLVMHGGLFRKPPEPKRGAKRRKSAHPSRAGGGAKLQPGTLDHLRHASKGGMDPDGCGSSLLATDVLWSDPVAAPGFWENEARGVGLTFGPDVTEAFLQANGLRLIIRSHEGPDARDKRSDLPQVLQGYSLDHDTPAGQLFTVFSAPDYPQFQVVEEEGEDAGKRYDNLAAVAVLSAPDYATPTMRTFAAVKPRPKADAYYDYTACCDSDTDAPAGSEGGSSAASEADFDGDEVEGPPVSQTEEMTEAGPSEAPQAAEPQSAPTPELDAAPPSAQMAALDTPPPSAEVAAVDAAPCGGDAMEVEEQEQQHGPAAQARGQMVGGSGDETVTAAPTGPESSCPFVDGGGVVAAAANSDTALTTPICLHNDHDMAAEAERPSPQEYPAAAAVTPRSAGAVVAGNTIETEAG